MTIGERISGLADVAGKSLSRVATEAGVDRGTLYSIVRGDTHNPGVVTLQAVANAIGVSVVALLDDGAYEQEGRRLLEQRHASFFAGHELAAVGAG